MTKMRKVPLAQPFLKHEEAQAAFDTILSGWVTQGPRVNAFEASLTERTSASYACATTSCTTAMYLALKAIGVKPGDEVITVSYSFAATANVIRQLGAVPVFIDILDDTFNMNPELVGAAVTEKTRAILCVHQLGMPCDMERLCQVAIENALPIVEDAACAIGSQVKVADGWQPIGNPHGVAACFSFHPRKILTAGDGGAVTTNDFELDQKVRLWRHHSMSVSDVARSQSDRIIWESYEELGYNFRMTDIQAAVLVEQLNRLDTIVAERRRLADRYSDLLQQISGVSAPIEPLYARSNWQTYSVAIPKCDDLQAVMQFMLDRGVQTRRSTLCCHLEKAHSDLPLRMPLPVTETAIRQNMALPLFVGMSEADQNYVVSVLSDACKINRR